MKRAKRGCAFLILVLLVIAGTGWYWMNSNLAAVSPGAPTRYFRVEKSTGIITILERLEREKLIRSAAAARLFAKLQNVPSTVRSGTYSIGPGMTTQQLLDALEKPIRRMVRIPETNWGARNANLLEKEEVLEAEEYKRLMNSPEEFKDSVDFPLPKNSLEGYLYPDTYDLPPMIGAKETIVRQLQAFEKKVWEGLNKPKNLERAIIVASMVELEVAHDAERPMVAGVIENRVRLGMPLQIDATINYALQKWRPLTYDDYRNVDSPYNTYRTKKLPPGPICSPSVASIKAALNPAKHDYLFYVAMPGTNRHMFAKTYSEHLRNVAKRRQAMREQAAQ